MSLRAKHLPGLDGLRALAVLSVVAYHLDQGWIHGGFLGVDLFFVLSGFLITTLLLEEREETGRLALVEFWRRRARRLLPALFLMVAVVVAWPLIASDFGHAVSVATVDLGQLRGYGFSSLFYYANWFAISSGHSYFAATEAPSALTHTWSLAIEEQFYVVWPLLTYVIIRRGASIRRKWGIGFCVAVAASSSLTMALLFRHGSSSSANFVYNASFTRLFDLACGAALAWVVLNRPADAAQRRWSDPLGVLCLGGFVAALYWAGGSTGVPTNFMFEGGFLLCALLGVGLITAVRVEGSLLSRLFALAPLRYIGRISYGIYLWHWPVIVYVTTQSVNLAGKKLLAVRIVLIVVATIASYYLLEKPIRARRWKPVIRRSIAVIGSGGALAAVIFATTLSLFPVPSIATELAAYAPSSPPAGSGGVLGHLNASWVSQGHFSSTNPMRILVIGDSIPYFSSGGILAALGAMPNVIAQMTAYPNYGLHKRRIWHFYTDSVSSFRPHVVIFINHADEPFSRVHPARYQRLVYEFSQKLFNNGVKAMVFGSTPSQHTPFYLPFTPSAERSYERFYHLGSFAWRADIQAVVRKLSGQALYLPLNRSLEVNGNYETWTAPPLNPTAPKSTWSRVRMIDGIHMCPVGTEVYASALTYDLSIALGIHNARSGWWKENWPYVGLVGRSNIALWCPNDHP